MFWKATNMVTTTHEYLRAFVLLFSAVALCATLTLTANPALAAETLTEAVAAGKPVINIRYRFENVDQNGAAREANASTVRARLGYTTDWWRDLQVGFDFDHISTVGNENFNDTRNGRGTFPVVADPETTEVNQAYAVFRGMPDTILKVGRQRVILDNARFVGNVGFRQNEQTYDAVVLINTAIENVTAIYGYVFNVNRIFGNEHPFGDLGTDTHILNLSYKTSWGKLTAHALLIDLDSPAVAGLSSNTFGLRFAGSTALAGDSGLKFLYALEFATQSDAGRNPGDYSVEYFLIEPGISIGGVTAKFGYEVLDGNGTQAFQTPLATLHAFQGVTDKFLTTPANGMENLYLKLAYKVPGTGLLSGLTLSGAYNDFSPEKGGGDYGSEWGLKVAKGFKTSHGKVSLSAEVADYDSDGFATDTTKIWLTLGLSY